MNTNNFTHINLSQEQAQFAVMIDSFPWLSKFWNWEKRECDIDLLEKQMQSFSHGERILAQFFLSVWTHENHSFDLFEATSVLDKKNREVIIDWVANPFYP